MGGGGDGEFEDGLEVGLVEGREDPLDVVHEHLAVDVRLSVGGVGEAVQALAGAGVPHAGVEVQLVGAFGEAGERQAVVGEGGRVEGVAVEGGRAQLDGLQLDEGVCGGAGREPDDGGRVEGFVVVAGEVEGHGVVLDVDELGSELRFVARECGHGAHAAAVGGRTPSFYSSPAAIVSWWRMTSAMMKLRSFSAKAGSSLAFSASWRRRAIWLASRPGSAGAAGGGP